MTPIHVVGIGLDGLAGLGATIQDLIFRATLWVGSDRPLSYLPDRPIPRLGLGDISEIVDPVKDHIQSHPDPLVIIFASGDPLFFGLGRFLLEVFPRDWLTFHPHYSAAQLAFSRLKVPWQDAVVLSGHGRSLEPLIQTLQRGAEKIAIYTDAHQSLGEIARLYQSLGLPVTYQAWLCENLGGDKERLEMIDLRDSEPLQPLSPLNILILLRQPQVLDPANGQDPSLPLLGLGEQEFYGFPDRPGLMTKREVRVLILAELGLSADVAVVWDIGAGTGSVSIEIARLLPNAQVYAIEKTAMGEQLIRKNCDRHRIQTITAIRGTAPAVFAQLPAPDRVFLGGSGGYLDAILPEAWSRLCPGGVLVMAFTTLEHQGRVLDWCQGMNQQPQVLQINLGRSIPLGPYTRLEPLNPVSLIRVVKPMSRMGFSI
ncbi:precorrin-6y C5,15-methyltransferase (decarboxylating) subunit CbiE [Candidatus Synechococcus calcipolaris G9]|uniref:Precorrin-6y C5,15-methyltransferase (Decarboxylating) subunit CbiE n=1 Tax=Candidatus Synechococcus calcipolaris G9 TaxID=1497997 RepID=A0ABT6EUG6_9SYNE|nr:precorrin-6y C5,15-methyltransferase (decarboxylating) subunit CbiE [Candidatus Synechococcus calcipolaris]MDG2989516.1 precorrin-6y C5,15-methyltransferase (decarboxylating) subunit CbiE [Candidatus Synechococcus calcipolaris G9]